MTGDDERHIVKHMRTATIRRVQHHFNQILAWVADGETVTIPRRHYPIARLTPAECEPERIERPDFMVRLRKHYGKRVLPDSQRILGELREDRF